MGILKSVICCLMVAFAVSGDGFAAGGVTDVMTGKKAIARWGAEGLTSIRADGIDVLYANPNARLDGYRAVLLKSVTVAPNLDWRLKYYVPGTTQTLNLRPMLDRATARVHAAIRRELEAGGYKLVDQAAADVVTVTVSVVDIFLMAVKIEGGSRIEKAEGFSLGSASLVVDIHDSLSNDVIVSAFDLDRGPKPRLMPRQAGEEAEAWLHSAIDQWAVMLRKALDVSNRRKSE